jgi:hypothetical protein
MDNAIGKNFLSYFNENGKTEATVVEPIKEVETTPEVVETPEVVVTPEVVKTPEKTTPKVEKVIVEKTNNTETVLEKVDPILEVEKPKEVSAPEVSDELFLNYLKEKHGKEITSIEELFKQPEPTNINPYENLNDKAKEFLKYTSETDRSYEDFLSLNKDYTNASPLELAREKAIAISNGKLSEIDVDEYLERKLGIDISEDMDKFDLIDIESYTSDYKAQKLKEQEAYIKPLEKPKAQETVTLENGSQMLKADYDKAVHQRQNYLDNIKTTSDNIKASVFEVKIDDNGTDTVMKLNYDYSKEDVLNMASYASDIDNSFQSLFGTDKGLDYAKLQEGMFWASESNRGKAINAIVHKALAEQKDRDMKDEHNTNFNTKRIPSNNTQSRTVPVVDTKNNFGVKFDFLNLKK